MAWAQPLTSLLSTLEVGEAITGHSSLQARPRLAVVMHDFALGGTERIAVRLANKWAALGVDVEIFCGKDEGPLRDLVDAAVRVIEAEPAITRGKGSLRLLAEAARRRFATNRVDAVYIPGNTHWPVIERLARLPKPQRPRIIAQVSAALEKPQRGRFRQLTFEVRMRQKLRAADHVVGLCWEAAAQTARILRRSDVSVIPLPALEDRPERVRSTTASHAEIVFAASRLVAGKGVEHLIRAFARLGHPTARLVIAGSGPEEAELRALIDELGLGPKVDLLGYVADVRPWLDRATFLAMPSDHEGYPAVIVEALAAGRPVLATDCTPAVRELLGDATSGMVVPISDVAALAEGIGVMLGRAPVDPDLLAAKVERFRIGPVARRYLSLVGIVAGFDGRPARLLVAANDPGKQTADCVAGPSTL